MHIDFSAYAFADELKTFSFFALNDVTHSDDNDLRHLMKHARLIDCG